MSCRFQDWKRGSPRKRRCHESDAAALELRYRWLSGLLCALPRFASATEQSFLNLHGDNLHFTSAQNCSARRCTLRATEVLTIGQGFFCQAVWTPNDEWHIFNHEF